MSDKKRVSMLARSVSRCVAAFCGLCLCGCVSWMDSEVKEREAPQSWVDLPLPERIWTVDKLGLYNEKPGAAVWAGIKDWTSDADERGPLDGFVLGPGDEIEVRPGQDLESLQRRSDIEFEASGQPGPLKLAAMIRARRCHVVAHRPVELAVKRVFERVVVKPTGYRLGGKDYSPAEVDSAQAALWLTMPPVELGRLVTRAMGGRFVAPNGYEETVVSSFTQDDADAPQTVYRMPVDGCVVKWELELAGPAGATVVVSGEVETAATGRSIVPVWEHAAVIRDNIDFGTVARLTVAGPSESPARPLAEVTVDLLQLDLEAPNLEALR